MKLLEEISALSGDDPEKIYRRTLVSEFAFRLSMQPEALASWPPAGLSEVQAVIERANSYARLSDALDQATLGSRPETDLLSDRIGGAYSSESDFALTRRPQNAHDVDLILARLCEDLESDPTTEQLRLQREWLHRWALENIREFCARQLAAA